MPTCPVLNNCIFPLTDVQLGEGCWSVQVHLHVSGLVIGQHMYCMLTIGQLSWQWCVQWAADLWNADKAPPQNWPCHRPSTLPPSYMDRYILQLDRYFLQFIQIHLVIWTIIFAFCTHRSTTFPQTSSTSPIPNNSSPLEHLTQPSPHQSL